LLTGERINAAQALATGLATRVASSDERLIDEVTALARGIAAKPPTATLFAKQAARASTEIELQRGLDLELDLFALLVPMQDVKEAALAFREKRAPQFTGQ
jgi:enoyl-CoA hydratase